MSLCINNQWITGSGEAFHSTDPATGETAWEGNAASARDVDAAVMAAREAFPKWSETALDQRIVYLKSFADHLKTNRQRLAQTISREMGKPMWIRYVLVPGLNDDPGDIDQLATFVATLHTVERLEVLPFHKLGAAKYAELGIPFPLAHTPTPAPELVGRVRDQFASHGITTT